MANLPGANVTVSDTATAVVGGTDVVCVIAPVALHADAVPRLYGSASAILAQHGYCEGVEFAALHAAGTGLPIVFVGLPIATAGAVGSESTAGNKGTSASTVTAGGSGCLTEHDGVVTVVTGGTVGTSQIVLDVSVDGGVTSNRVRLGTATSYTLPLIGVALSFTVGTLVAGDVVHTWHGSGPRSNAAGWALARAALAGQLRFFRSVLLVGDLQTDTEAAALLAQIDAYKSANDRATFVRASVYDREPLAAMSKTTHRMTSANVTFAEVGATADTITRASGSFTADGFANGDILTISGSASNNKTCAVGATVTSATVITLGTDDLANEGPVAGVTIIGTAGLTFAAAADTVTRSSGSWLTDGFRVGATVTVAGTVGNNGTYTVAAVTALVLDLGDGLADEVIGASACTITAGQTKAAWMAEIDAEFATIDAAPRISLAAGRARVYSPLTATWHRRPPSWRDTVRSFQHDLHIAPWRKSDGPTGDDLFDADGQLAEWDDRVDGSAGSAARFTTYRTWSNGPAGAFLAHSLTRASDASLLSLTHNQAVVDLATNTAQLATEAVVGRSIALNANGTAAKASLSLIEAEVNSALELALLTDARGEGARCSSVRWTAATTDILNVPEAVLNGTLEINLNGTIHTVNTTVRVLSGGQ